MKKRAGLLIGILFTLIALLAVPVGADTLVSVFDSYDLLNDEQEAELNAKLVEIYDTYGFDAVLLITEDVYEDERRYAAEFMQTNSIGYGEEMDGMCIFHQPDSRIITIVFRGQYQDDFSTEIQDIMLDHCTAELAENDVMEAYQVLVADLEKGLGRVTNGKTIRPMDMDGSGIIKYALTWLVLSFAIMAIPVLILVLIQMMRMKTRTPQKNADFYAPQESFDLEMCRDIYLRTDVKRTKIEKDNHGSGRSGSFKSGGERFSGSSRKY